MINYYLNCLELQQELGALYTSGLCDNETTHIFQQIKKHINNNKHISDSAHEKSSHVIKSDDSKVNNNKSKAIEKITMDQNKTINPTVKTKLSSTDNVNKKKIKYNTKFLTAYNISEEDINNVIKKNQNDTSKINTIEELRNFIENYDNTYITKNADSSKKQAVFGEGTIKDILLIGEAPGDKEEIEKKPFIGRSGKLLDKALESIGIERNKNIFITNCTYWRPPLNRRPELHELDMCLPFLEKTIQIVQPKIIVTVGITPFFNLTRKNIQMKEARESIHYIEINQNKIPIFPIYHPSFLLRMGSKKKDMWYDLLKIKEYCKENNIEI